MQKSGALVIGSKFNDLIMQLRVKVKSKEGVLTSFASQEQNL